MKLRITYFYYNYLTGEIDKKIEALNLWRKTYPSQLDAVASLSDLWERVGQSEKAVEVAREGDPAAVDPLARGVPRRQPRVQSGEQR